MTGEQPTITGSAVAAGLTLAGVEIGDPEAVGLSLVAHCIVIAAAEQLLEDRTAEQLADAVAYATQERRATRQHQRA